MAHAPVPYDVASVNKWYLSLPKAATEILEEVSRPSNSKLVAVELVRQYITSPTLREAFGGPIDYLDLSPQPSNFSEWYKAFWGRRCIHYIESILKGISTYIKSETEHNSDLHELADLFSNDAEALSTEYSSKRPKGIILLNSLDKNNKEHILINFPVTNIDSILFSSLFSFAYIGRKYSEDKLDSLIYKESGIKNEGDFEYLQEKLIEVVRQEVSLYTPNGEYKSDVLMDDSTLWWAVYELILFYDDEFYIGENNKALGGMSFATNFVQQLIIWTKESFKHPDFGMGKFEITFEIHCKLRTQLLIIKNGLNLYRLFESKNVSQDFLLSLKEFIDWELAKALNSWRNNKNLQGHAYFIGLALEILCLYQSEFGDFEQDSINGTTKNDEDESYYARVWTLDTGKEGEPISEKQYYELISDFDEYKIFIINENGFKSKKIGAVFFNKKPCSKKSDEFIKKGLIKPNEEGDMNLVRQSRIHRIIVYSLKTANCPKDVYDYMEYCWCLGDSEKAKPYRDGTLVMTSKYSSGISKASTILNNEFGVKILLTQKLFSFEPDPPEFCVIDLKC